MRKFKSVHLQYLVICCVCITARADWWDDFSNNMATDLAPLLALFGERVTMQFLSESTSWVDNFIFAMAPLGVVTAVVSAIRVCGGPGLRAFIGRAQEGGGIAEAELCSSTSRDVCELYHNGAIVRVFGRPKILEVVHDRKATDFYTHYFAPYASLIQSPRCGIYTFQEYIEATDAGRAEWEEGGVKPQKIDQGLWSPYLNASEQGIRYTNLQGNFAPNPNLSFNIGIVKRSAYVSWVTAGIGLLVQASVLLFGAFATYYWQWEKNGSLPKPWAFPLMVTGTLLLTCGMFGCAFLIERSTKERKFYKNKKRGVGRRKLANDEGEDGREEEKSNDDDRSSVYITQPGNQTIGDQSYDPFAFSDSSYPSKPITSYITSWKVHPRAKDRINVWFAVGSTAFGFGFQFTGLRAMHSSVSVVLLAATLTMSALRSALRTSRLKGEQNLLRGFPEQVEGHELDWLAMQMGNVISWSVNAPWPSEGHDSLRETPYHNENHDLQQINMLQMTKSEGRIFEQTICAFKYSHRTPLRDQKRSEAMARAQASWLAENESIPRDGQITQPHINSRVFYYRRRLADMTAPSNTIHKSRSSMIWDDDLIPVRQQALHLKRAIESCARILFTHANMKPFWKDAQSLAWGLNVVATSHSTEVADGCHQGRNVGKVHIFLHQPDPKSAKQPATWEVGQSCLEAVLGLWIWSIASDPLVEKIGGNLSLKSSMAEAVWKARIVSMGDNLEPREIRQLFENWAGDLCPPMHQDQFLIMEPPQGTDHRADHHGASHHGPSTLWITDQKTGADYSIPCLRPVQHKHEVHINAVPRDPALATIRDPSRDYPMRFFGWPAPIPTRNELHRFLWVSSENTIPKMCAQDLFQHFLGAMVAIMNSIGGQTNLVATAKDSFRLSNNVYSELVESIHESGLGSRQDAHVILIPVLGSRLPLIADVQLATQSAPNSNSKVRPA